MACSMQHGEVEISRLHSVAICKEISERLAICLNSKFFETPPNLIMLARRLRDKPLSHWPPVRASRRRWPRVEMRDPPDATNQRAIPTSKGAAGRWRGNDSLSVRGQICNPIGCL
jgi:hypothetical protein